MGKNTTLIVVFAVSFLAFATHRAWAPSPRDEGIRELLRDRHLDAAIVKVVERARGEAVPAADRPPLDQREIVVTTREREEQTGPFDQGKVESELDAVPLAAFETSIVASFGPSREGLLLKRIVIGRRYDGHVAGAARLEDLYVEELARNPDISINVIATALKELPKSEFREEHVFLRDLSNRIPDGYARLQELVPDEEFQ